MLMLDRASFSRIHRPDKSGLPRRVVSNDVKVRDSHVADRSESVGDCLWRRAALKRAEEVLAGLERRALLVLSYVIGKDQDEMIDPVVDGLPL